MQKKYSFSILFSFIFILGIVSLSAQENTSPKLNPGFIIGFSYGYDISAGDMSKLYGNNFKVDFMPSYYFNKSNISIGLEGSYLFGNKIKQNTFLNLLTFDNHIIDNDGNFATVQTSERGVLIGGLISKIIPFDENIRTGIKIEAGGYMFRHWINFKLVGDVPQLKSDYLKGYDRLTGGFAFKEFIGYQHLEEKSKINFYAGFEFYQGFTKSLRAYNYDKAQVDNSKRKDLLYGVKIGWILPLYIVENPEEIYY